MMGPSIPVLACVFGVLLGVVHPADAAGVADTADTTDAPGDTVAAIATLIADASEREELVVPALLVASERLATIGDDAQAAVALADRLAPLARRAFASGERLPRMRELGLRMHRVAAGEGPKQIRQRYHMREPLLRLLNPSYDDRQLRPGQELKVWDRRGLRQRLLIRRGRYRALLIAEIPSGGVVLVHAAPVGIGSPDRPTPLGRSTVRVMVRNPEWTHPDTGEVIAPDDPRNVLGGYWIGLQPGEDQHFDGIGLHGYTGAPSSDWLQKAGSRGCLRLLQSDIHALFCLLQRGQEVWIVD